jgi:hypothetical protein
MFMHAYPSKFIRVPVLVLPLRLLFFKTCITHFSLRRRELQLSNFNRTPKAWGNNQEQLEKGKQQRRPTRSNEHQPRNHSTTGNA